ncbi:MAG: DUF4276 family protein [Desulfurellaceae bacterium]|nr:DUF4276 family protein [Desulfurellaceae bacterium]
MAKNVLVIASGETERRSLRHLVEHLKGQGTSVSEVSIPPNNKVLNAEMAEKLIKSAWYADPAPDKIVLLVDVDGKLPEEVVSSMRNRLADRLPAEIRAKVQYAYAQWHLEAWYFADAEKLRIYLGRNLGSVDTSKPDEIQNPKHHLKQLLDKPYTARVSEQIALRLDGQTIALRSPSFRGFLDAALNGAGTGEERNTQQAQEEGPGVGQQTRRRVVP